MTNRIVTYAKHHSPESWRVMARRAQLEAHNARLRMLTPVAVRSEFPNIYHCAMRKTASQWVKAVFSDPIVYRHSGLVPYVPRYHRWTFGQRIPEGRIATPLFISHKRFAQIPKPEQHRAFFVLRDPRDMVVSNYFSTRNSHAPMGDIPEQRRILRELPFQEGLIHVIGHLAGKGTFNALRTWVKASDSDAVQLVRYEDLTGERQPEEMARLLAHCGIPVPPEELETLLDRYSFARMSGGRPKGDALNHYRKGKAGDWRNHFDDDVYEAFVKATGNLVDLLGYPAHPRSATSAH